MTYRSEVKFTLLAISRSEFKMSSNVTSPEKRFTALTGSN
jgi:hypothetical protein